MKNTILILISLLVFTGCEKEVTYLQDRNGIKYEVNSEVGYTGKYVERYKNGQKWSESNFVDGKRDGLLTTWDENGQKSSEWNYVDGKWDGLHTSWYENGQKKSEGNYVGWNEEGLHTSWYGNGQKKSEDNYVDGKKDGLSTSWYKNGLYGQKFEENYKNGKLVK